MSVLFLVLLSVAVYPWKWLGGAYLGYSSSQQAVIQEFIDISLKYRPKI